MILYNSLNTIVSLLRHTHLLIIELTLLLNLRAVNPPEINTQSSNSISLIRKETRRQTRDLLHALIRRLMSSWCNFPCKHACLGNWLQRTALGSFCLAWSQDVIRHKRSSTVAFWAVQDLFVILSYFFSKLLQSSSQRFDWLGIVVLINLCRSSGYWRMRKGNVKGCVIKRKYRSLNHRQSFPKENLG